MLCFGQTGWSGAVEFLADAGAAIGGVDRNTERKSRPTQGGRRIRSAQTLKSSVKRTAASPGFNASHNTREGDSMIV